MKIKIGVMGSASGPTIRNPRALRKAYALGVAIATRDCILFTGACPGLPDRAAAGARHAGGFVFGISPAFSRREHVEIYGSPLEHYDMILYSGMGLMERDIINIRSADAIALVGGGMGSLNEFTVAYEEKKPIGVLMGTGGLSDHVPEILAFLHRREDPQRVLYDSNPARLIARLLGVVARFEPPVRESDVGGEKEERARLEEPTTNERAEATRRRQRFAHDLAAGANHGEARRPPTRRRRRKR
jgi:uncharacterized protein (TIGR00725 family)